MILDSVISNLDLDSGCQCNQVRVKLRNGALQAQSSRQGVYERSGLVNGKTSWISDSQAIWYVSELNFWCIGTLDVIGTAFCGISSTIGINEDFSNCFYDVEKQHWEYHAYEGGWINAGPLDVNVTCLNTQGIERKITIKPVTNRQLGNHEI